MDAVCLTRHARDDRFGGPLHTLFIGLQDPNGPFEGFGLLYKFNLKAVLKQNELYNLSKIINVSAV